MGHRSRAWTWWCRMFVDERYETGVVSCTGLMRPDAERNEVQVPEVRACEDEAKPQPVGCFCVVGDGSCVGWLGRGERRRNDLEVADRLRPAGWRMQSPSGSGTWARGRGLGDVGSWVLTVVSQR